MEFSILTENLHKKSLYWKILIFLYFPKIQNQDFLTDYGKIFISEDPMSTMRKKKRGF